MPIGLSEHQAQEQITAIDNSAHHCDEAADNSQDKNANQQCHGDSYQCCLGLVIAPLLGIDLATSIQALK